MTAQPALFPPSHRLPAGVIAAGRRGIAAARAQLAANRPQDLASMRRYSAARNALANASTNHRSTT